ncbi:hypothetical protein WICPIJ_004322 [Wickerhamomyces pijperi]|uniref:Uncharacterized protein n=1 Tax=Wickerhamomyces pijperi TaxID=599730 RepID=A0A9P8Q7W8_WICPI|nr:hypothetical protein WICPIJ_004322 [Wickerhamomyces pijperi]
MLIGGLTVLAAVALLVFRVAVSGWICKDKVFSMRPWILEIFHSNEEVVLLYFKSPEVVWYLKSFICKKDTGIFKRKSVAVDFLSILNSPSGGMKWITFSMSNFSSSTHLWNWKSCNWFISCNFMKHCGIPDNLETISISPLMKDLRTVPFGEISTFRDSITSRYISFFLYLIPLERHGTSVPIWSLELLLNPRKPVLLVVLPLPLMPLLPLLDLLNRDLEISGGGMICLSWLKFTDCGTPNCTTSSSKS